MKTSGNRAIAVAVWRFMLFACIGLLMEVTLGAAVGLVHGDYNLRGSTCLWMILDYGLLGVLLAPIRDRLIRLRVPLLARGVVYMLLIYMVEYISGVIFTAAGLHIWDYHCHTYQLHGHIALVYAPLWYVLGLFAECIYGKIHACAEILQGNQNHS